MTSPGRPQGATRLPAIDGLRSGPVVPRLPAIEGLRAVAVTAVVLYHLPVSWLPGGFLGVDVFFVISGFLITSLLTAEVARSGHIGLGNFYRRRARRLLPALGFMLVVIIAASAIFARDALSLLASDVPAVLGYFTNWWLIFHHVSYFQSVGRPSLVLHLWSLAVEEQFYLLWPLVVLLVIGRQRRNGEGIRRLAWVALAGSVASSAWMAIAFHPFQDPSRVYFGTDTHAGGLLLGAALSIAFPPWSRSSNITRPARRLLGLLGLAGFAGLFALMAGLDQYGTFTYRGGLQLATVASAVIILVATHPALGLTRLLAAPVLQWIGRRSYAIYLWHWPIFELTRPGVDVSFSGWDDTLFRVGLVLLAADLSYRLVEQPFRIGAAQRVLATVWAGGWRAFVLPAATSAVVVGLLSFELASAPLVVPAALASGATPAGRAPIVPLRHHTLATVPPAYKGLGTGTTGDASPSSVAAATTTTLPPNTVLAIGDSVMLDAATDLEQDLGPATVVDAVVGRQVQDGITRLGDYRTAGRLSDLSALVIGLGTNGPMSLSQCDQILNLAVGIPRVIFVNVRMPRPWEPVTNQSLTSCTADKPGVVLVDWYDASSTPGILGPDQIHATPSGATLYASMVSEAASCATTIAQATVNHCGVAPPSGRPIPYADPATIPARRHPPWAV